MKLKINRRILTRKIQPPRTAIFCLFLDSEGWAVMVDLFTWAPPVSLRLFFNPALSNFGLSSALRLPRSVRLGEARERSTMYSRVIRGLKALCSLRWLNQQPKVIRVSFYLIQCNTLAYVNNHPESRSLSTKKTIGASKKKLCHKVVSGDRPLQVNDFQNKKRRLIIYRF